MNVLKFGIPTLIEAPSIEETTALCVSEGYDFVELNMNFPQYCTEMPSADRIRAMAKENSIFYTLHLDENLNVCDFNPLVSEAYMQTVRDTIALAKDAMMPTINMHMARGVYITLPDRKVYLFDVRRDCYMKSLEALGKMCRELTSGSGVTMLIENTDGWQPYEMEATEMLLSYGFMLTFDIGHSHAVNDCDESFLLSHENSLRHFHLHDGKDRSNHLTLGTGEIDLRGRISLAQKHNCTCVVETKTVEAVKQSAQWLRSIGYMK